MALWGAFFSLAARITFLGAFFLLGRRPTFGLLASSIYLSATTLLTKPPVHHFSCSYAVQQSFHMADLFPRFDLNEPPLEHGNGNESLLLFICRAIVLSY